MKHCCQKLEKYLEDNEIVVDYHPIFRIYSIDLATSGATQRIHYCPWCGTKFPKPLKNEFWDIIENQLNIETDIFDFMENPTVPEEFKSEEWWIKREL